MGLKEGCQDEADQVFMPMCSCACVCDTEDGGGGGDDDGDDTYKNDDEDNKNDFSTSDICFIRKCGPGGSARCS